MTELEAWSFRTKTGTCTITQDRIVLSRTGLRGAAAQTMVGGSLTRVLVVYLLLAAVLFFSGAQWIVQGELAPGALFCGLALYLIWGVIRSRGLSAVPEIPRSAIQRVEAHRPIPPLVRGYFIVHFTEQGAPRKRLIMLPGVLSGGGAEFKKAQEVLRASGVHGSGAG